MSTSKNVNTLTPVLVVRDANDAINLYKKALGAEERTRLNCPNTGKVAHATLRIGNSTLYISDEFPEMNQRANAGNQTFYVYFDNVNQAFNKAKSAGFKAEQEPQETFWGDKVGRLRDRFGITWSLAQHVRDVSRGEMEKALEKMAKAA